MPTVLSSSFQGLAQTGYAPDSQGAVGPSSYVETVNQTVAIYSKTTGQLLPVTAGSNSDALADFFGTQGGLAPVSPPPPPSPPGSPPPPNPVHFSDPVVTYDNLVGRFIIGDQNISDPDNGGTGAGVFDIAVSTSSKPATLTSKDWTFYQINTTQTDPNNNNNDYFGDYPGNLGYNADALVFTLNELGQLKTGDPSHSRVFTVNMSDLVSGVSQAKLHYFHVDAPDGTTSLRPTAMHDSKAGDPMWLLTEGGNSTIDVYKMTNLLSAPALGSATPLTVNSYSTAVPLVQPDGTKIASNIDSRILQAAETNNVLVAAQTIAVSNTEDDARWYEINVSSGTPVLQDQGNVPGGNSSSNNTYAAYPGIDINSQGDIGMSFLETGTAPGQFLSMWIAGRTPSDPKGTMETPVLVQAGTQNYSDSHGNRAGDLSGINVDADSSFWAINEFANNGATLNWGTAISHFTVGQAADLSVAVVSPPTVTAGGTTTFTITVTNNGPSDADNVTLTDTVPTYLTIQSVTPDNNNPDQFTQSAGNPDTYTAATMKAGASDVFKVIVPLPSKLAASAYITNTATISSSSTTVPDPNLFNNTATAQSTVTTSADLSIVSASGPSTVTAGKDVTYTVTIKNNGPSDAQNVTVSDLLPTGLVFKSTPAAQSSGPDIFTVQGNSLVAATVGAGNTDVLQFFASAPSSLANGALLTDTASVTTNTTDPTTPDNAQISSTVTTSANLAVTVSSPPPAVEGDTLTYTVNITNNGPSDAQNVVLSDVLSPGLTLVSANFGTATVSSSGNTITVPLGTLTAGNTVTGTIIVQTTEDGNLTNSATVTTSTPTPTPSNNTVTVTTAVAEGAINLTGGVSLNTTEFAALNKVTLATFTHAQAVEPPGSFTAIVSWGDGSTSSASVVLSGTTYAVVTSHTYNVEGNYSILVTVSEDGVSASTTDAASIQESPLPPNIPQNIAANPAFETIEDSLSQPFSVGQVFSIEMGASSLLLQTALTLFQQGQDPSLALPDLMAATVIERIDDIFRQPLSASQLLSMEMGTFGLYLQTNQSLIQQEQSPEQALLSSFYLDQVECNLFATILMNNGAGLDSAVNEMMSSLMLQTVDAIDASTDL